MWRSNFWNRFIYRLWSPIYDRAIGIAFPAARSRAIERLDLKSGERVLIVGIGTGADLPLLPENISATGVDLSAAMLARAQKKLPLPGRQVALGIADAQNLPFESNSFDVVMLMLILSVVPDPVQCLREAARVLRPNGRAVVFDKFLPDNSAPSIGRKAFNLLTNLFGTDINRRFGDLVAAAKVRIVHEEPSIMAGAYRIFIIQPNP